MLMPCISCGVKRMKMHLFQQVFTQFGRVKGRESLFLYSPFPEIICMSNVSVLNVTASINLLG